MTRHYFMFILRLFTRSKLQSLITLFGLTIGLTASFLATLLVWQETHYDDHIPSVERLYMVESKLSAPGREDAINNTSMAPLAEAMESSIPGVENTARVWRQWSTYTREDDALFSQVTFYVDASFFELFPVELLAGSYEATFKEPQTIMLSKRMAFSLFGDEPAIGKTLLSNGIPLKVTAIYKDLPKNSHLEFDMVSPINAPQMYTRAIKQPSWQAISIITYLKLAENASPSNVQASMDRLVMDRTGGTIKQRGVELGTIKLSLFPIQDIHLLAGDYSFPIKQKGDLNRVLAIFAVGILVLIIACFNHVNLSTARAMKRAREVAMRKVVGASRPQLIKQFLSESAIYCGIAWLCALVIAEAFLPFSEQFLGIPLVDDLLWKPVTFFAQFVTVTLLALAAGLYPAFYLSRFMPQKVLTAHNGASERQTFSLRTILVFAQFTISIGLIIAAFIIFAQVRFAQNLDVGFDQKNLIVLYGVQRDRAGTVKLTRSLSSAIAARPGVISVTGSSALPSSGHNTEARIRLSSSDPSGLKTMMQLSVGMDYFTTYKVPMIAGRQFSDTHPGDRLQWDLDNRSQSILPVVLNSKAVQNMGFATAAEAIGKLVIVELAAGEEQNGEIVGVASDFHFRSLRSEIAPMIFYPDPAQFTNLTVRYDPAFENSALEQIETGWKTVLQNRPMPSDYLENNILQQYQEDNQQLMVIGSLATLAILIALLGLYGLATFMMERRAREVGIRKVLGARVRDIIYLIVWQFSKPVLLANILAWPIVWYLATRWLDGFAYRIELTAQPFLTAGLVAMLAAWIIVGGHTLMVMRANPIKALRTE